jgi:hypothetical protein
MNLKPIIMTVSVINIDSSYLKGLKFVIEDYIQSLPKPKGKVVLNHKINDRDRVIRSIVRIYLPRKIKTKKTTKRKRIINIKPVLSLNKTSKVIL